MKTRIFFVSIFLVASLFLQWQIFENQCATKWNAWMNNVGIASQVGNSEKQVVSMLGTPVQVYNKPEEVIGKLTPIVSHDTKVGRVYRYAGIFPLKGFWQAYIYLDKSGIVVGSYVRPS